MKGLWQLVWFDLRRFGAWFAALGVALAVFWPYVSQVLIANGVDPKKIPSFPALVLIIGLSTLAISATVFAHRLSRGDGSFFFARPISSWALLPARGVAVFAFTLIVAVPMVAARFPEFAAFRWQMPHVVLLLYAFGAVGFAGVVGYESRRNQLSWRQRALSFLGVFATLPMLAAGALSLDVLTRMIGAGGRVVDDSPTGWAAVLGLLFVVPCFVIPGLVAVGRGRLDYIVGAKEGQRAMFVGGVAAAIAALSVRSWVLTADPSALDPSRTAVSVDPTGRTAVLNGPPTGARGVIPWSGAMSETGSWFPLDAAPGAEAPVGGADGSLAWMRIPSMGPLRGLLLWNRGFEVAIRRADGSTSAFRFKAPEDFRPYALTGVVPGAEGGNRPNILALSSDGSRVALRVDARFDLAVSSPSRVDSGSDAATGPAESSFRLLVVDTASGHERANVEEPEGQAWSAVAFVSPSRLLGVRERSGVNVRLTFVEVDLETLTETPLHETTAPNGVRIGLDVAGRRALLLGKDHRLRVVDLAKAAERDLAPSERVVSADAAILGDGRIAYAYSTASGAWLSVISAGRVSSRELGPAGAQIFTGIGGELRPGLVTVSVMSKDFSEHRTVVVDTLANSVARTIEGATVVGGSSAHFFPASPRLAQAGSAGARLLRDRDGRLISFDADGEAPVTARFPAFRRADAR